MPSSMTLRKKSTWFSNLRETWLLSLHVTRRNWMVYRKDFILNISPTLSDPAFYILSLGLGLGGLVAQIEGRTYIQFIAPGLAMSTALMTSIFETSYGFFVRMTFENIYKAMLTTQIGVREVVLGEFIWVAIKGSAMSLGSMFVLMAFGLVSGDLTSVLVTTLPVMVLAATLVALACGSIGLIASANLKSIDQFQSVYSFFISPLFFFSGIFFPVESMPKIAQGIAYAFPLVHGVKLAQMAFWNQLDASVLLIHGSVLTLQAAILCWIAYRQLMKKLRQ